MLISDNLQPEILKCGTHDADHGADHGSDHSAISLVLERQHPWKIPTQRRSYNMADWAKITEIVESKLGPVPEINSTEELDRAARMLESTVQSALQQAIPASKSFPYVKRWWSFEVNQLRREYNWRRNLWTTATRRGDFNPET